MRSLDVHFINSAARQEYKENQQKRGMRLAHPRLQQGSIIANRPPTNKGTLVTSPPHVGIAPIPAAWSQENQLPLSTVAPQKRLCINAATEPTV